MVQAVRQFADPQIAHDFSFRCGWPNGVTCPRMGCGGQVAHLAKHRRWYCNDCKRQFTAKVGTIFEDSPIGFDKWLPTIWLVASNRNGYLVLRNRTGSARHAKDGLVYAAPRSRGHERRQPPMLSGSVEADETYVGGYTRGVETPRGIRRRKARGPAAGKTIVMGIVERKGRIRAFVVPSVQGTTLQEAIVRNVKAGTTVYTDQLPSYAALRKGYIHHVINHSQEYVRGHVHTNNIEAFWSVFKRTIRGTYIAPRPWHLKRYVEEQVCRFNAREEADGPRFASVTARAEGKRLTYRMLVSKRAP